jgi:hypothetical protein
MGELAVANSRARPQKYIIFLLKKVLTIFDFSVILIIEKEKGIPKMKAIWFDMDGTLADFYGVENWLQYLINSDPTPYKVAKPLLNMSALARRLNKLQKCGYTINIVSWLSKNSTAEFDEVVTTAKLEWLHRHLPSVKWNEIHIVRYGINKSTIGSGILFDDEEPNRKMWGKDAHDVHNILEVLKGVA